MKTNETPRTPTFVSLTQLSRAFSEPEYKLPRVMLYLFFLGFLAVNIYEGILLNFISKKSPAAWNSPCAEYVEPNLAISYILDAMFRIGFAYVALMKTKVFFSPLKGFTTWQWIKLVSTRGALQFAEQLSTLGTVYLAASVASVVNQTRIPLVGLLGYLLFCVKLTRNQSLYAIAIIPLAVQFNLIGETENTSKDPTLGFILLGASVLMSGYANVMVENILKVDFKGWDVWNKQFVFAWVDLPIMFVLYVVMTALEIYVTKVGIRSWNPFDSTNWQQWYWLVSLGLNAAIWGVFRLLLLNYADALWLNLTSVFVMGVIWIIEVICKQSDFHIAKLLGLFSLTLILVGYEFATRDAEEKEKEDKESAGIL